MKQSSGWTLGVNFALAVMVLTFLTACPKPEEPPPPPPPSEPTAAGAVFTATNLEAGGGIVLFERNADGSLTYVDTFATGGLGADDEREVDPLGSQESIVIQGDRLYTINAGSDEISVFNIEPGKLTLVGTTPSGGDFPVSVAVRGDLLYVLNVGGEGNITGFRIAEDGGLSPIPDSTRTFGLTPTDPLNIDHTPSQVSFVPGRDQLIVTTKGSVEPERFGQILVYALDAEGRPAAEPVSTKSAGAGPFGFVFTPEGHLLVVEAGGGAGADGHSTGAVTSYRLEEDGTATVITPSVDTRFRSTCWITAHGRYAWVTNAEGLNITGYHVAEDGSLTRMHEDGHTAPVGEETYPLDLVTTADGRFLYTLNPGQNSIGVFQVDPATGHPTPQGQARIPHDVFQSLQGIAVYDY